MKHVHEIIEDIRSENERLREALEEYADDLNWSCYQDIHSRVFIQHWNGEGGYPWEIAREALKELES